MQSRRGALPAGQQAVAFATLPAGLSRLFPLSRAWPLQVPETCGLRTAHAHLWRLGSIPRTGKSEKVKGISGSGNGTGLRPTSVERSTGGGLLNCAESLKQSPWTSRRHFSARSSWWALGVLLKGPRLGLRSPFAPSSSLIGSCCASNPPGCSFLQALVGTPSPQHGCHSALLSGHLLSEALPDHLL